MSTIATTMTTRAVVPAALDLVPAAVFPGVGVVVASAPTATGANVVGGAGVGEAADGAWGRAHAVADPNGLVERRGGGFGDGLVGLAEPGGQLGVICGDDREPGGSAGVVGSLCRAREEGQGSVTAASALPSPKS